MAAVELTSLACFKPYDIRGRLGDELDENIAWRIGRAYAQYLRPQRIVVGCDVRCSSEGLKSAVAEGLMAGGADVIDLGMTGTEEIYFAAFHLDVDGGIEVTASHNPMDYNGMKLVGRGAQPISGDSGLHEIRRLAETGDFAAARTKGRLYRQSVLADYVRHLLGYVDVAMFKPLKLVVNAGNGAAGHVIDEIERHFRMDGIPVQFIKVHHEPDGGFPHGIPNPLLPECRMATAEAVRSHGADMGIAWDGDFDRCFLFDESGAFIEGYYIVGLLADAFLAKHAAEKIIHDPRLIWNTIDIVETSGGIPVQSKTGHAFVKERMRRENAVYGGEMSAHHYFRDFAYCDSGMIPWLLVAELLGCSGIPLSRLVGARIAAFPCSGELNYRVQDAAAIMEGALREFADAPGRQVRNIDRTDGIGIEFDDWRFNLRSSNTEPLLRLNVETRGDVPAVTARVREIERLIRSMD